ncbi:hypothetical protein FJT64_009190 [Amphibalanus amphitrite]|uniref:Uncharacterized protein n=1 Tax=Amphibalanus amphitrite TaxID=1232801 RepID=A0A6A4VU29_AMPAM|nr:hypothetical protein FJT64_009190 [Amphibalanus amphitrite]
MAAVGTPASSPPLDCSRVLARSHTVPDLRDRDLIAKDSGVLSEDPSLVQSEAATEDLPPVGADPGAGGDRAVAAAAAAAGGAKALRAKRTTLMQHYYPERGWGWVVVACAVVVQVLCHGLHTGYGAVAVQTTREFGASELATGEYPLEETSRQS